MKREQAIQHFKDNTLKLQVSHRGGGIAVSLTPFGFEGQEMSAYQNYLGGGMLGRILSSDSIRRETLRDTQEDQVNEWLDQIAEWLRQYFHSITNPDEDEWESVSYEQNQTMSGSAY